VQDAPGGNGQIVIGGNGQVVIGAVQVIEPIPIDRLYDMAQQPYQTGQITVTPGKYEQLPTIYAGAVRIRAIPPNRSAGLSYPPTPNPYVPTQPQPQIGERFILLDVAAEPRLENFTVLENVFLRRAIDEHGQELTHVPNPAQPSQPTYYEGLARRVQIYPNPYEQPQARRQVLVRLKPGEKTATVLKELAGTLSARVLLPPEPLVSVDNVLQAAGKTFKGTHGGSMEVVKVEKQAAGEYRVQMRLQNLPGTEQPGIVMNGAVVIRLQAAIAPAGGKVKRNVVPNQEHLPALVDEHGKSYQLAYLTDEQYETNGNGTVRAVTLIYRAENGQGEPSRLVFTGRRTVTFDIPFALKNVVLQTSGTAW
jgi:hypothetical protein